MNIRRFIAFGGLVTCLAFALCACNTESNLPTEGTTDLTSTVSQEVDAQNDSTQRPNSESAEDSSDYNAIGEDLEIITIPQDTDSNAFGTEDNNTPDVTESENASETVPAAETADKIELPFVPVQ